MPYICAIFPKLYAHTQVSRVLIIEVHKGVALPLYYCFYQAM